MQINSAGRQNASSADESLSSENTENEYRALQTQFTAVFGVMPALLPGGFSYGVPFEMAQAMAECVVNEKRKRLDPLSAAIRRPKIQKLVDDLKQEGAQVRLVLSTNYLIPID